MNENRRTNKQDGNEIRENGVMEVKVGKFLQQTYFLIS
jgi:hypothetical protein